MKPTNISANFDRLEPLGWNEELKSEFVSLDQRDLVPGRVVVQHSGAYDVSLGDREVRAELPGKMRQHSKTELPVTGDWVVMRILSGDGKALIRSVLTRRTKISRRAAGMRVDYSGGGVVHAEQQVLAANVDWVFIVNSFANDLRPARIQRYLAIAHESGALPVVVLTKSDLVREPAQALDELTEVIRDVPFHQTSTVTGEGIEELNAYFDAHRTVALIGPSGVGKSTLVNCLAGSNLLLTREIRSDGKGRHTTVTRELMRLPNGGLVIDTPGMRELGMWDGDSLDQSFDDVYQLSHGCRFNDCTHSHEPGCAVLEAIDNGDLPLERLSGLKKLEREIASLDRRQDLRAQLEEKRRWKAITKGHRRRTKLEKGR